MPETDEKRRMRDVLRLGRVKKEQPRLGSGELRTAWQIVSLLMDYPDAALQARASEIVDATAMLPEAVRTPLARLASWIGESDLTTIQTDYVDTFDYTRKCALHLSYFGYGDTRKRGVALVRFKQAYRAAGFEVTDAELPDHLCVVCDFGANGDVDVAWHLLNDHRAGLEVLRRALEDRQSPWADGIIGLLATLPDLGEDEQEAVARLLAEGPPGEDVGMDAYSLDPRLNPSPAADAAELEGALS